MMHILSKSISVALLAGLLLLPAPGQARINVVTLPGRDSVQLTIYNSVDLTMVKETRFLSFRKGLNRLEFSWANTLIDLTSVEFRPLTHADEIEMLDASFPPRVANTLEWRIQSELSGEVQVEIRYFTSGISWAADYAAEAAPDEKSMGLAGFVRVNNNSGEDYENSQVRLVVGVVRLVEEIVRLAQHGRKGDESRNERVPLLGDMPVSGRMFGRAEKALEEGALKKREVSKESLSEYFLYTVEGRDTIPNGWGKRLPSFQTVGVPLTSYYKYERERFGDQVMRYYRFTNSVAAQLGKEPLPDGAVKAMRLLPPDQLYEFVGRTAVKYIPINETVEMELGNDREVEVKPTLLNWEKTNLQFDQNGDVKGWTTKERWRIEVQNSKAIDVVLDIRRNFSGDWTLLTAAPYENVDATKVKFVLPLKPREKQTLEYELTTRYGTSATK